MPRGLSRRRCTRRNRAFPRRVATLCFPRARTTRPSPRQGLGTQAPTRQRASPSRCHAVDGRDRSTILSRRTASEQSPSREQSVYLRARHAPRREGSVSSHSATSRQGAARGRRRTRRGNRARQCDRSRRPRTASRSAGGRLAPQSVRARGARGAIQAAAPTAAFVCAACRGHVSPRGMLTRWRYRCRSSGAGRSGRLRPKKSADSSLSTDARS